MKKKTLSKPVYWTLNMLFYSFCILGLIWQLIVISISYFKYEVVSDTKIITPEEDKFEKYFNFCYWASDVLNYTTYENMIKKYGMNESKKDDENYKRDFMAHNLTFREQFDIAMTDGIVDKQRGETSFLYSFIICHHMRLDFLKGLPIFTKHLANVSHALVQISKKIPNIDVERRILIAIENGVSKQITISSVSFYGKRLAAPYSDRCVNFESYSFSSYSEATTSCIDVENNRTKVCHEKIVSPNDTDILDYRRSRKHIFQECEKYYRLECNSHTIFTHLVPTAEVESLNETYKYEFTLWSANQPSYNITSKPKIDDVDLITYILGAMGSWIGFSFAGINPIPFFAQVKEDLSEFVSKIDLKNIKIIRCIDRERERNRIKWERNAALLQRINEKMSAMDNELRCTRSKAH